MDVLLGSENANPIERELANRVNGPVSHNDLKSDSHIRMNPSDENEIRNFSHERQLPRQDFRLNAIFSIEITLRLSQEKDAMMSMMHSQINRAINSSISERVIPEIQKMISSISSGNRGTESGLSSNNQENNDNTNGLKTKITKKDSRSAFDLRDTEDLSPYSHIPNTHR